MRSPRRIATMAAVTLTAVLALPASALAGAAGQSAPGESNLGFLLAGLVVAWAGFFAYTIYLSRKNRDLRRELDDLKRTLAERNERQPRDRQ